ncbi:AGAP008326-PA-like protein [Anopheles sinensis]|uniref:AGAP008326-PA-like protein n=1 Tax=Anopheles sinensis TaxID=74873 RepID=A0A084VEC3_ANOSI|nr:AGAP008326-PA-like protein [Anopheles sinensis]
MHLTRFSFPERYRPMYTVHKYKPLLPSDRRIGPFRKKKTRFKVMLLMGTVFACLLYAIERPFWWDYGSLETPLWNEALETRDDEQHFNYNSSYFVNTAGCKMPSFPVLNERIQKFIERPDPIDCVPALLQSDDRWLWFRLSEEDIERHYNVTNASLIQCCVQPFVRLTDDEEKLAGNRSCFEFPDRFGVMEDEFIMVHCRHPALKVSFYGDYFAFAPRKKSVEERIRKARNQSKGDGADERRLNVMILGIDAVSRLNLHRQMNQTVDYVLNTLNGIEMFGYNKVGDNTFPNMIPALTGLDIEELGAACLPNSTSTFDLCQFLWNKYGEAGYRTVYAEDSTAMGTFNYAKNGFRTQPTDYYLRSFFRRMESKVGYNKKLNAKLCLGGRSPTRVLLDYARKLVRSFEAGESVFSLLWAVGMTHDFFNAPALIDDDYRQVLEFMNDEGQPEKRQYLNRTVLILMSDHGIRWGSFRNTYQGMMEERQPFLIFILPTWFRGRYPAAYHNLRRNRLRLTTHFDLYETLKDVLDLRNLETGTLSTRTNELLDAKPTPRGISLFLPIPTTRTCEDAGIAPHWCTCHEHKPLSKTDRQVIQAARFAVNRVNHLLLDYPQCSVLHLNSIEEASVGMSSDNITTQHKFSDINVRFVTKPGDGEFEATVRIDSNNESFLTGTVSRTNLYGKQSFCVDDYRLKLYCFCGP